MTLTLLGVILLSIKILFLYAKHIDSRNPNGYIYIHFFTCRDLKPANLLISRETLQVI